MPSKDMNFTYYYNGINYGDIKQVDYYTRLIEKYQNDRIESLSTHQSFEESQLIKERYTDVIHTSNAAPISSKSLLFTNRTNGYMAFTDSLKTTGFLPIPDESKTVNSFFEYLSKYKDSTDAGFFYIGTQLCCYASISRDEVYVLTQHGETPLLFYCDEFTYTENTNKSNGVIGVAKMASPFFKDISVNVYTSASLSQLEKYYPYVVTSSKDPHPRDKIPGEPIYKTLKINGFDSNVKKIKINNTTLDVTGDLNKVVKGSDDRFNDKVICYKYTGSGNVEIGFVFPFKPDPLIQTTFPVSTYSNDKWSSVLDVPVYFTDNFIHSLTPTLTVDLQDLYLDVPTIYTLRVENRYFFQHYNTRTKTSLLYLDKTLSVNIRYNTSASSRYVFKTDSVIIPSEKGDVPKEYTFKIVDTYDKVNGFTLPVWVYGYTTGIINRVPDSFIVVEQTLKTPLNYTEYTDAEYTFDFDYNGTIDLIDVEIKQIADDYDYFTTDDFSIKFVSKVDKKLTYKLILKKKLFTYPVAITKIPMRILFHYKVRRKDLSEFYWNAVTYNGTMTITYVKDRWELLDAKIDNVLLGEAVISYKIKDKLLNQYTDKYSANPNLTLNGYMEFSNNVNKPFNTMDWDFKDKRWSSEVNVIAYGDITLQFIGIVAQSNKVTLTHNKPTHPLKFTPVIKDTYVGFTSRTIVNLSYSENITLIIINGTTVNHNSVIEIEGVDNGWAYISPIYSPDKKRIIALGIDFTPLKEGSIKFTLTANQVNQFNYSHWPSSVDIVIPVKPQKDVVTFTFTLDSGFKFDKDSSGTLKVSNSFLDSAKVVAVVRNASNNVIVARPNFNPMSNGVFKTTNLFIEGYLSSQKSYLLELEINEYEKILTNDALPNKFYCRVTLPFKVP